MSQANLCRLCRNTSNASVSICDANGHFTEVYAITIKFFHPMFLDLEHSSRNQHTTMCVECWHHISGFNNFQQTVLLLQAKLLKDAELGKINVQAQVEFPSHESNSALNQGTVVKVEEEFVSLSEVELKSEHRKNQLIVTDCEVKFETNLDGPSDTISIADSLEEAHNVSSLEKGAYGHDEEFEDPVGVFAGGEFNDDEGEQSDMSFSELEMIDVRLSPDNLNDLIMQADDTIDLRSSPDSRPDSQAVGLPRNELKKKRKSLKELDSVIAQWKPALDCGICQEKFSTFMLLKNHFRENHPDDECYILCCDRRFKYRCRIEEHVRIHLDPTAFKCNFCNRCFAGKCSLDTHVFYLHPNARDTTTHQYKQANYKHKCDVCGKAYKVPSALREHYTIHTGEPIHKCSYCERSFKYRSSLCHHLTDSHPEKVDKQKVQEVIRGCSHCPRTFKYRTGLYHHLRLHHPEEFAKRKTRRPRKLQ